ncbi:DUF2339 domain-containing protein [bacterium]|nr:DUF2339 domain-containing protein [bacterium]
MNNEQIRNELEELKKSNQTQSDKIRKLENRLSGNVKTETVEPPVIKAPPAKPSIDKMPTKRETKSPSEIELLIGGNLLNKIGIFAFLVGISFFLKYAFEHQWIKELGRIILGVVSGIFIIGLGEYFNRQKLKNFAQSLIGLGTAIIYLSIYVGYNYYHLISLPAAFILLILIITGSSYMSMRHNSLSLGILCLIGAFLVPILVHTDKPNLLGLFGYLLVIDITFGVIARYKNWRVLNAIMFTGTYIVFGLCSFQQYPVAKIAPVLLGAILFYVYFLGLTNIQLIKWKLKASRFEEIIIIGNSILFNIIQYSLLKNSYLNQAGFVMGLLAVGYIALSLNKKSFSEMIRGYYEALGIIFVGWGLGIYLDSYWLKLGWAVCGAGVIYLGLKFNRVWSRTFGLLMLYLAIFKSTFFDLSVSPVLEKTFFINQRFITHFIVACSTAFAGFLYHRFKFNMTNIEKNLEKILIASSIIQFFWYVNSEIYRHYKYLGEMLHKSFDNQRNMFFSIFWTVYASVLMAGGFVWRNKYIRVSAMGLLGLTILKVFFYDLWNLGKIYRMISFIVLGVILILISFLYNKIKDRVVGT